MTKALYAEFVVMAGAEKQVSALVDGLTAQVRQEPGNLAFVPYTLESDPRHWFVYEVYEDDAAFQAHITAPYGRDFNARLEPLVEGGASRLTWLIATEADTGG